MKCFLGLSCVFVVLICGANSEGCKSCVTRVLCPIFNVLNHQQQMLWKLAHPCITTGNALNKVLGYETLQTSEEYVCCSNELWTVVQNILGNSQSQAYPNRRASSWVAQNPPRKDFNNINTVNQGGPVYNQPKSRYLNNNPTARPTFVGNNNVGTGQCPITRHPPRPETGCCGREAPEIIAPQSHTAPNLNSTENTTLSDLFSQANRVRRSEDVHVTIDQRITGGKETELRQFPWTVLLRTTFNYGNQRANFDCGGSLISSRYVLTAAHCVFDSEGIVAKVEVFLSEYDKRTYPLDCKIVLGQGERCVENLILEAENFVIHPQYNNDQLKNDIALIRLNKDAPYTDHIRPICLPSINVDLPEFSDLSLAVTGWGRNGMYRSDVKQSTVVNLVPQQNCKQFYTTLSEHQLCAAGHSGEDTCKGDSGGPLMTVHGGKYEIVGIVSGKRADSPCGTSVPSLYTNVYHYLGWIWANIRN